jgi:ribosomal protein L34
MHAEAIVTRVLGPCLGSMHTKRAGALLRASAALLRGGTTSLSAIALRLGGATTLKHRLKSVDRLLGNTGLQQQRWEVYRSLAQRWGEHLPQILVVIDWSDLTRDQRWQLLRASVAIEGRALTLYEEVHPQKRLNNAQVHRRFLRRIHAMLPAGCTPIVMTDAGFHAPWFKAVAGLGWQFIGRIRGRNCLRLDNDGLWIAARDLYGSARMQARDLGPGAYARTNPVEVRAVLAKRPSKGRHRLNIYGAKRTARVSARNARSAREPWLLVSSRGLAHLSAEGVVALYSQRMRIEQSFRDTKNLRFGLGLEVARSRSARRLEILLLIAHLAGFVQRLIGESAKQHQLELQFMATRRADRREISVLTLGRRILNASPRHLKQLVPWQAIPPLTQQAIRAYAVAI